MERTLEHLKKILFLRASQLLINERYKKGDFKVPVHLAMGHEAIAVAVDQTMQEDDFLVLSHRNIHYNLARLGSLKSGLDEYYLRPEGLAQGELGSMNLINPQKGIHYTSSILGNNLAVAAGMAMGKKVKQAKGAVLVVTGDGAIEEGSFYESILFEKSHDLPVIIIIENNQWSLGTKIEERRCAIDIEQIARSVGAHYERFVSNDVTEYAQRLGALRSLALEKKIPVCVEVELTTLGSWYVKSVENPSGRFINYHAGPAPEVNAISGPVMVSSSEDPVFVLMNSYDKQKFTSLYEDIVRSLEKEIA